MKKMIIVCAAALILIAGFGCAKSESPAEPAPTATPTPQDGTVSGTLSGLPASPAPYYVYIDNDLIEANGFITQGAGVYTSGTGTQAYSVTVSGGTYYVYAFADLNSNGVPETGEYFGNYGAAYPLYPSSAGVSVDGGISTADISMAAATANLSGTITLPGDATGKTYTMVADLDGDGETSDDFVTVYSNAASGATIPYSITIPYACTFYLYCVVDMDGSGGAPNTGDYIGVYQTFPTGTPITITDLSASNGPYDFACSTL